MRKVHGKHVSRNRNIKSYRRFNRNTIIQEKLLTDTLHEQFTQHILEKLVTEYDIPEHEALKHIKESVFTELLEEDPDFVFHHDSSFWANAIFKEKYLTQTVTN